MAQGQPPDGKATPSILGETQAPVPPAKLEWDGEWTVCRVASTRDDRERGHDLAIGCLVVIYTEEPGLLGKRLALESDPTRVGRGADNHVVLAGDRVSRRHAHFEHRAAAWLVVDDDSTHGTYCNDEQISREKLLKNGDRVKIGSTIFEFLSGADVDAESELHGDASPAGRIPNEQID